MYAPHGMVLWIACDEGRQEIGAANLQDIPADSVQISYHLFQ